MLKIYSKLCVLGSQFGAQETLCFTRNQFMSIMGKVSTLPISLASTDIYVYMYIINNYII